MGYWRVLKVRVYSRLKFIVNGVAFRVFTMLMYSFTMFICIRMCLWTFQFQKYSGIRPPSPPYRKMHLPAKSISDCGCALGTSCEHVLRIWARGPIFKKS